MKERVSPPRRAGALREDIGEPGKGRKAAEDCGDGLADAKNEAHEESHHGHHLSVERARVRGEGEGEGEGGGRGRG